MIKIFGFCIFSEREMNEMKTGHVKMVRESFDRGVSVMDDIIKQRNEKAPAQ